MASASKQNGGPISLKLPLLTQKLPNSPGLGTTLAPFPEYCLTLVCRCLSE